MRIPQVSTAFCGQPLRTGSLIIAWLSTIFVGIVWSLYLSVLPVLHDAFSNKHDRPLQGFSSIIGMILTYFFAEQCLLLWGVLKKRHYFLLPWIVITCLTIAFGISSSAISLFVAIVGSPMAILFFVPNSLITSALVYCLLVISSYYEEISNENSHAENSAV